MDKKPLVTKRCKKCVLPETYPGIEFNEQGICSYCLSFEPPDFMQRQVQLETIIKRAKTNDSKYQAVVPFSGGKDSSYVLYYMRKVCGLRVLAVNFNNGFRSNEAELNLDVLPEKLGIDCVSIEPQRSLMNDLYAAFMKDAGEFCSVCNSLGYLGIMTYIVRHMDLLGPEPLVVSGWVRYLEEMPNVYAFDIKYFHDIVDRAGLVKSLIESGFVDEKCLELLMGASDPRKLDGDTSLPLRFIALPEYICWDLKKISEILKSELAWTSPPSEGDDTHFDCTAFPVAQYLEKRKYGFSQSTITYSAMIRQGQMTREIALRRLEKESCSRPREFDDFLKTIGLRENDINWSGKWYVQRR